MGKSRDHLRIGLETTYAVSDGVDLTVAANGRVSADRREDNLAASLNFTF